MNGISCRPDDSVEIETPARSFLTAAFLVFIFPLILSIAASFAVASIDRRYAAAGFFGTFLFAELLIFGIDRIFGRNIYFQPKITGRIGDADHGKIQDDRTPGNS